MKLLAIAFSRVDDRLNAVFVRELRQAVKGGFVTVLLCFFLLVSSVMLAIFLGVSQDDVYAGGELVLALQAVVVGTCLLFLPAYAAVRLSNERSDGNTDLLFASTLSPRAVVWGKLTATMALAVLIYSACLPFVTVSFLLRGVDLPSAVTVLAVGFAHVALAVQLGLLAAAVTSNRALRSVIALIFIFCLFGLYSGIHGLSVGLVRGGVMRVYGEAESWLDLVFVLSFGILAFVGSTALLSPPSANRALSVRLTMSCIWIAWFALAGVVAYMERTADPFEVWAYGSSFLAVLSALVAVGERETLGPRVVRRIPRSQILRIPAFLFFSGAAGGIIWSAATMAITAFFLRSGIPYRIARDGPLSASPQAAVPDSEALAVFLYVLGYSLLAVWLRRTLLARVVKPHQTLVLVIVLGGLACGVPPLVALLSEGGHFANGADWYLLFGPASVFAFDGGAFEDRAFSAAAFSVLLGAALNAPWIARQVVAFRPPDPVDG